MLQTVTLSGALVRLEPLASRHADDLAATTGDPETWQYHGVGDLTTRAALDAYIASVQNEPAQGTGLNFAIISIATGRAVGSTALFDVSLEHERGRNRAHVACPRNAAHRNKHRSKIPAPPVRF